MIKRMVIVGLLVFIIFVGIVWSGEKKRVTVGWESVGKDIVAEYEVMVTDDKGNVVATAIVPQGEKPTIHIWLGESGNYTFSVRSVGTNSLKSSWRSVEYEYKKRNQTR